MIATLKETKDVLVGKYPALEIVVKKQDGSTKSYRILKFDKGLVSAFQNDVAPGDVCNITFEENDKGFMNIVAVKKHDGPAPSSSGSGKGSTGSHASGKLTNEEWAEIREDKAKAIARAVALKAAVDNTKVGAKAETLIAMAEELVPYLLGEDNNDSPFVEDTDADVPTPEVSEE